jgi:uncharacterized LabA/DUF88 family protein
MTTKTADSKGRIALGSRFANRTVIVEELDDSEIRITLAQVIPEKEVWLYKNPKALDSVRRGLAQAKKREFTTSPPDLRQDAQIAERIDD